MGLYINRKIHGLVRLNDRQSGAGEIQQGPTDFSLSCTCPPSTSVVFRGGLAWWDNASIWPTGFILPTYEVDLADTSKCSVGFNTSGQGYTFTNANWYLATVVVISDELWAIPDHPPFPDTVPDGAIELGIATDELETATEAEVRFRALRGDVAAQYGIVAGGIIIRNNGNTDIENQYMPIDPINRGRSYLFGARRAGWGMG